MSAPKSSTCRHEARRRWTPEPIHGVAQPLPQIWIAASAFLRRRVRNLPAKLLEVNRKIINNTEEPGRQSEFYSLIGYAVVRAIADAMPNQERISRGCRW